MGMPRSVTVNSPPLLMHSSNVGHHGINSHLPPGPDASIQALQGCTVLQLWWGGGGVAYKKESFKPSPAVQKLKETVRCRSAQ